MPTVISSTSSNEDIARVYVDSVGYDLGGGNVAMCENFIAACRALQIRRPTSVTVDGNPVTFDHKAIAQQLREATNWLSANRPVETGGSNPDAQIYDMSRVRG